MITNYAQAVRKRSKDVRNATMRANQMVMPAEEVKLVNLEDDFRRALFILTVITFSQQLRSKRSDSPRIR